MGYVVKIRWNIYLNVILCEVGHWLWFLVEATLLSKVMRICLVIALVDLIRIHE